MQLQPTSSASFRGSARQSASAQRQKIVPQLTLYGDPPTGEIPVQDFERLALDRLVVLKSLETLRVKGKSEKDLQAEALRLFDKHIKGASRQEGIKRDHMSHFILRLAYSTTEDHRSWFTEYELALFKARFAAMDGLEQADFLKTHDMPYNNMSEEEFMEYKERLAKVFRSVGDFKHAQDIMNGNISRMSFYKVPFEEVCELVRHRQCLLHRGYAFVVREQLTSLVATEFKRRLSAALIHMGNNWNRNIVHEEVGRLKELVEILPDRYVGKAYTKSERGEEISAAEIPQLIQYFPLCMHSVMEQLQQESHLKHMGRRQLQLFLKSIGLPLEEALRFWRKAFAPRMDSAKFDKEQVYGIRYNYGIEGKRTDWSAYNCVSTVAMYPPAQGQAHGCPYKTFGENQLRAALARMSCSDSKIDEAVSKARGGHYQLACAAVFEGRYGCSCDAGIMHPTQYYDQARKQDEQKKAAQNGTAETAAGTPAGTHTPSTPAFPARPTFGSTPSSLSGRPSAGAPTPAASLQSRLTAAAPPQQQ